MQGASSGRKEYGADAFAIEVLELLEKKDSVYFDMKKELKKLDDKWIDPVKPFGERGYHSPHPESGQE